MTGFSGHASNPAVLVRSVFQRIYATRMADVPLCNRLLRVETPVMQAYQGDWLGVVVTPWMMSLTLLPGRDRRFDRLAPGTTQQWELPAGTCEFLGAFDAELGAYRACSLFSPMTAFADQASAEAVAVEAFEALMTPQAAGAETVLSRRALIRGLGTDRT